jgi:hypothetical protein
MSMKLRSDAYCGGMLRSNVHLNCNLAVLNGVCHFSLTVLNYIYFKIRLFLLFKLYSLFALALFLYIKIG